MTTTSSKINHELASARLRSGSFHNSVSGSETDVSNSTSTENLTQEEKHVLRHSTREEPQGEETTLNSNIHHHHQSSSFILNSPASAKIHNYNSLKRYITTSNDFEENINMRINYQGLMNEQPYEVSTNNPQYNVSPSKSFYMMSHEPVITSNINQNITLNGQQPPKYNSLHHSYQLLNSSIHQINHGNEEKGPVHDTLRYSYQPITDISQLPPPPEYQKAVSEPVNLKGEGEEIHASESPDIIDQMCKRSNGRACLSVERDIGFESNCSTDVVAALSAENIILKQELDYYYLKVSKLQKVENEVCKVHSAHEELVKTSEKREKLERAVRVRLDLEIKRLQESNKRLKVQLDSALVKLKSDLDSGSEDIDLKKELHKRDMLLSQLISRNKELVSDKERQEVELSAQRATLQEQRTHIDIMDNALTNAQANVVKLEEECRKKHTYVERVSQLQKALTSLQIACDKREVMEKTLRSKLEKEIEALRKQQTGSQTSEDLMIKESEMKKQIRQCEEKIIALEAEVIKLEQRCLEESTMRQIAIENASVPKDVKIAALEKTSQESEKLIAEARIEKLKQMDELYQSQRKFADIETKMKDLESKLAEKEAMIKVLQKQSENKNEAIQNAMLMSPRHSPHPSILHVSSYSSSSAVATSDISNVDKSLFKLKTSNSEVMVHDSSEVALSCVPTHKKYPSQDIIDSISGMKISSDKSSTLRKVSSDKSGTNKTLDEQLKDVESQLSSKDSIINALRAEKQKYPNHFWRV